MAGRDGEPAAVASLRGEWGATGRWRPSAAAVADVVAEHWGLDVRDAEHLASGAEGDALLLTGPETAVAKLTYDEVGRVEDGLLASERVGRTGVRTSAPITTVAGALTLLVEGPPGHAHPLAVMRFVPGVSLRQDSPGAAALLGELTGRIHAVLAGTLQPAHPLRFAAYLALPFTPPEGVEWLAPALERVLAEVEDAAGGATYDVALWEGPEVLVDVDGTPGLVDWGLVEWRPRACHVANQLLWLNAGPTATADFLAAYRAHLPLGDADVALIPTYTRFCAAVYARWHCAQLRTAARSGVDRHADIEALRRHLEWDGP